MSFLCKSVKDFPPENKSNEASLWEDVIYMVADIFIIYKGKNPVMEIFFIV
ncbi:hypothetical protein DEU42_106168 [Flavobacterium sp. AG291]|nr:hypothetical protein DEU42_106168 [Flavobacterium sp. AG291]